MNPTDHCRLRRKWQLGDANKSYEKLNAVQENIALILSMHTKTATIFGRKKIADSLRHKILCQIRTNKACAWINKICLLGTRLWTWGELDQQENTIRCNMRVLSWPEDYEKWEIPAMWSNCYQRNYHHISWVYHQRNWNDTTRSEWNRRMLNTHSWVSSNYGTFRPKSRGKLVKIQGQTIWFVQDLSAV